MSKTTFRTDITPLSEFAKHKSLEELTKDEWRQACPMYDSGYKYLSGLYCDSCPELYDGDKKLCPNNK